MHRYFEQCRKQVQPFVDRNFSSRGSISLHRAALGWNIAGAAEPGDVGIVEVGRTPGQRRTDDSRRSIRTIAIRLKRKCMPIKSTLSRK